MNALAMTHPPDADELLVARSRNGDREAFASLVYRYQNAIYSLCLRMVGHAGYAEEITQEVFLSAWRAMPRFREEARFDTWLRRIAVNRAKNQRVYQFRRRADMHDSVDAGADEDHAPIQLAHGGRGPDGALERKQAASILQDALSQLDADQRSIVLLRDMDDLDYDEIATILEIPRGTVKSRLHRARVALAGLLGRHLTGKDVF